MRLPADNSAPAAARAYLHAHFDRTQVPVVVRDEMVLIASELVTNSVQSGSTFVTVDVVVSSGELVLTVDDDGEGWPEITQAYTWDTAGRGLAIVDNLSDHWEVSPTDVGKRVQVARRLRD
jgi:anti-sigma regulatory factor (Ser/Thr protein kinase)